MHPMRITFPRIFLVAILVIPFFVYAQTTTVDTTIGTSSPEYLNFLQQLDSTASGQNSPYLIDPSTLQTKTLLDSLEIKMNPEHPGPLDSVQVSVDSSAFDIDKASVSWTLNGITTLSGVGARNFTFVNGATGRTTRLSISITPNQGGTITKTLSWVPLGLTALWQANTYTPPFYRGKALLTAEAGVRVTVISDDTTVTRAGSLAYVWKKNDTVDTNASGYGKSSYYFVGPRPFDDSRVSVVASTVDNSATSQLALSLPITQPFVLFYEKDPLLGVWYNNPVQGNYTLSKKQFSISAEPYFFSNEESDTQQLSYNWLMNGVTSQNYGRTITFRNDLGAQGDSVVSLSVNSIAKTFQEANQSLHIYFNNSGDSQGNVLF